MNPRFLISLLATITLITIVGLFGLRHFGNDDPTSGSTGSSEPATAAKATDPDTTVTLTEATTEEIAESENAEDSDAMASDPEFYWEDRLSNLLDNEGINDRELGRQLITLATNEKAPIEIREDAFRNALVFTDDRNYTEDLKPLVARIDLPESFNDEVLEDLFNRDPETILPTAREIARIPGHPLADAIDEYVKSIEEELTAVN